MELEMRQSEEIRVKMHNISMKYKKEKEKVVASGGPPSESSLYHNVHQMTGSFKIDNIEILVEESTVENNQSAMSVTELIMEDDSTSTSCPELPSPSYASPGPSSPFMTTSSPFKECNSRKRKNSSNAQYTPYSAEDPSLYNVIATLFFSGIHFLKDVSFFAKFFNLRYNMLKT